MVRVARAAPGQIAAVAAIPREQALLQPDAPAPGDMLDKLVEIVCGFAGLCHKSKFSIFPAIRQENFVSKKIKFGVETFRKFLYI